MFHKLKVDGSKTLLAYLHGTAGPFFNVVKKLKNHINDSYELYTGVPRPKKVSVGDALQKIAAYHHFDALIMLEDHINYESQDAWSLENPYTHGWVGPLTTHNVASIVAGGGPQQGSPEDIELVNAMSQLARYRTEEPLPRSET